MSSRLRVAAIDFLNPAPLMWDFEHPPRSADFSARYDVHSTLPSQCAADLEQGKADVGLIPVAALTPDLAIVPGCTIASLDRVRSIQLVVKHPHTLETVRTIAADIASRSSVAYAQILFHRFLGIDPAFLPVAADPIAMLTHADAALLIGDPALLALEARELIEATPGIGPCLWIDLAQEWRTRTGLPWVAAVWAARPESLTPASATRLIADLTQSRDHGLANIPALVAEWTSRIALPAATIDHYLTRNIHYDLDAECIAAIRVFRQYAAEYSILPGLAGLNFLG